MKTLFFSILIFLVSTANAESVEWKKIQLENMLTSKYQKAISSVLEMKEFLVKSSIKYNNPGMPNFNDLNESQFKISDLQFDESKGDYIAFSKIGLEVPVIGQLYKEHQKKLKELYRYQESFDLFKNIESINVDITLSDIIPEDKIKIVKNITKAVEIDVANFKPIVKFNKQKIEYIQQTTGLDLNSDKNNEITFKDLLKLLGEFGNAIGFIVGILLLGYLAHKILKMYLDFLEEFNRPEPEIEVPEEEDLEEIEEAVAEVIVPESSVDDYGEESPSFERFEKLLKFNKEKASFLIKKWIKEDNKEKHLALTGVSQQLVAEELDLILANLTTSERTSWNNSIIGYLNESELDQANKIIADEVIKEIVGGAYIDDFELLDIILSMKPGFIKDYILRGDLNSKILINLVNHDVVTDILNELSVDQVSEVVGNSIGFSFEDIMANLETFKSDLQKFNQEHQPNPFNAKLLQLVSNIDHNKEDLVYQFLAKQSSTSELVSIATRNIPSDVMFNLPNEFIKTCMQNYPENKKVRFLASLEPENRERIMGKFLSEGSNAKAVIDMEIDTLTSDQLENERIKRAKDSIWKDFLDFVRICAKNDSEHQEEIEEIVQAWVKDIKNKAA